MKLASIEKIISVEKHPNADALDLVKVLGYEAIVKKDSYKVGDLCVFIQPDTVLPDAPWASFYKAKSSRVKAIKLRNVWSMGIVESLSILGNVPQDIDPIDENHIGYDVAGILGVTKYEPPLPRDLNAKGNMPYGIFKTDEERYQNLREIPYGTTVDVTLKIDGSSMTVFAKKAPIEAGYHTGICSRSLELKADCENKYTIVAKQLDLFNKLQAYCLEHNISLALRGEMYGNGIQNFQHNPHAKKPLSFALFAVLNLDTLKYEGPDSPHYFEKVGAALGIETVPIIEKAVELTPELIKKYDEGIDRLEGESFEGVVIKCSGGFSFKIINKAYDAKKG
jgi:RNA ligase (TIGR02306 family)